jgi:hypothetical protein
MCSRTTAARSANDWHVLALLLERRVQPLPYDEAMRQTACSTSPAAPRSSALGRNGTTSMTRGTPVTVRTSKTKKQPTGGAILRGLLQGGNQSPRAGAAWAPRRWAKPRGLCFERVGEKQSSGVRAKRPLVGDNGHAGQSPGKTPVNLADSRSLTSPARAGGSGRRCRVEKQPECQRQEKRKCEKRWENERPTVRAHAGLGEKETGKDGGCLFFAQLTPFPRAGVAAMFAFARRSNAAG